MSSAAEIGQLSEDAYSNNAKKTFKTLLSKLTRDPFWKEALLLLPFLRMGSQGR